MPSVVALLEQHEFVARRRVDGLREEADRIQAELAEEEWQEWVIARRRVDTVLPPDSAADAGPRAAAGPREADRQLASRDAATRNRRCRCGVRRSPLRCCRSTTSASFKPSRTVSVSARGR